MRLINHMITGAVAALVLGFSWKEIPLVVVGTQLPDTVETLFVLRFRVLPHRGSSHAVLLWVALLILALVVSPIHLGGAVFRPWVIVVGALIHVFFDAFSMTGVPVFPLRKKPRIAFKLYRTGDVITEETFVWLFIAAGLLFWLLKNHH